MVYETKYGEVLQHHGVKGMKWGVRKKDDYKATINSMSRAGRALSTLNVYADKKKRLAEKGKNNPKINRFINHQKKVHEKYTKEAVSMVDKYMRTYGTESITPRIKDHVFVNVKTGKPIVTDPKLSTAVGVQKYVVGPLIGAGLTVGGILAGAGPRVSAGVGATATNGILLTSDTMVRNRQARRDYNSYNRRRYNQGGD